jgi:hypothetical protein
MSELGILNNHVSFSALLSSAVPSLHIHIPSSELRQLSSKEVSQDQ